MIELKLSNIAVESVYLISIVLQFDTLLIYATKHHPCVRLCPGFLQARNQLPLKGFLTFSFHILNFCFIWLLGHKHRSWPTQLAQVLHLPSPPKKGQNPHILPLQISQNFDVHGNKIVVTTLFYTIDCDLKNTALNTGRVIDSSHGDRGTVFNLEVNLERIINYRSSLTSTAS